jgi:hypothetical protein
VENEPTHKQLKFFDHHLLNPPARPELKEIKFKIKLIQPLGSQGEPATNWYLHLLE